MAAEAGRMVEEISILLLAGSLARVFSSINQDVDSLLTKYQWV